jgi:hypothetical protein
MRVEDITEHYRTLSDGELLRLRLEFDDLTENAQLAMEAELRARGLATQERMESFRAIDAERKRVRDIRDRGPGEFALWVPWGIGYMQFGKANRRRYADSKTQEYTTTTFFLFLWFPLIPIQTYRILDHGWELDWLERLPLDWSQVRSVWGRAVGLILLFVLVVFGILIVASIRKM